MDSVWITVASILTVYTIEKALSEDGLEINPSIDYTSSLLRSVLIAPIMVFNNSERRIQPPETFPVSLRA
jgi:hypothetical protein